ncbi:hypothetical protein MPER_06846, partial [Moniliophthora perniciosa FA553]
AINLGATESSPGGKFLEKLLKWQEVLVGIIMEGVGVTDGILFDQQTYYLIVAPGVDAALLAAICVCLDEKENENKN